MTQEEYKNIKFKNINLSAKLLFKFSSKEEWIKTATFKYKNCGLNEDERKTLIITLDKNGRLCRRGADFIRADEENTYPISVYILDFAL